MRKLDIFSKTIRHILKKIVKQHKLYYLFLVMTSLAIAGFYVLRANIEKHLFDGTHLLFINSSGANINNIILYFLYFVMIYILIQIIIHSSNHIEELLEFKLRKELSKGICIKISDLSAENFEDANFLEKLEKAENGKDDAINLFLSTTAIVTYYVPYIIMMSFWLWSQSKLLVIAILLAFIPTVVSYSIQVNMFSKNEDNVAPYRRKSKAYEDSVIGKGKEKETRILGGFNFFMEKYRDMMIKIQAFDLTVVNKQNRMNILMKVIQSLSFICIIVISIYLAASGKITVGAFAAVFTSIDILYSNLNEAVSRQYASISESFATVENYYEFIENDDFKESNCQTRQIEKVENLSFKYPNSEYESLRNINFEIQEGERIAIVGENGAGKTTLAKLILGIYTPTDGEIHTYSNKNYAYTAVFQDYIQYSMSLKDNILLSDNIKKMKSSDVKKLLSTCGLDISNDKFDDGLNSFLGKEFGGIELSGGEWQKLAISRGIYKDFDFIVFDEPTASIDPIEESNIINMIRTITKDKTSLIITHRMASIKFVDRVFVMKEGELIEKGSHEDLMNLRGEYFRLYESQKNNYVD